MSNVRKQFSRCYISAPYGVDLGALPMLLGEQRIAWGWATSDSGAEQASASRIEGADFVVVVLNGTRADYRGAFEAGVAAGLGKPVLVIRTNSRSLPLEFARFATVKASLNDREALRFQLGLFLETPFVEDIAPVTARVSHKVPASPFGQEIFLARTGGLALELRVYHAIVESGGSALAEPAVSKGQKFRPDFLAWLGHIDAELFDPVLIEVTSSADKAKAKEIENKLAHFMQSSHVRMALVVTEAVPPDRSVQLTPDVVWLRIDDFERFLSNAQLGSHVREIRNRIVHGAQ